MKEVLNSGYVRLVSHMGDDLSIDNAARVSYDNDNRDSSRDRVSVQKLIHYLLSNGHTSPFEHVVFTFEVKAPIFVFRQWHRHRTWSFNEISARYTELDTDYYIPSGANIGTPSKSSKQARIADDGGRSEEDQNTIALLFKATNNNAFNIYKRLMEDYGVPREVARSVLPVGTYSRMYATVDLHNLLHFLKLRLHPHSQYEIRVYAEAMLELIRPIVPMTIEAWEKLNEA